MSTGDWKASKSHLNSPICPQIETVQNFIAVLITCKYDEDSIKNKTVIVRATFSEIYGALMGG